MCFVLSEEELYDFIKETFTTIYTVFLLALRVSTFGTNALLMPIKHSPPFLMK